MTPELLQPSADLFAAGYGSFDAQRQGKGAAVCYSLKDPLNPIFGRQTASGDIVLHQCCQSMTAE